MAYMIDPMALKYNDSTDSNSTVIRAQSFGSYTAQFVNCSLILFLILIEMLFMFTSNYDVAFG